MADPTEETSLVRRAKSDPEAFGALYEQYVKRIYNYVYYRTGNERDAEDLTARVFQRAILHLPKYDDRGAPFSAWLYRIAHNLVANWHRDRGRQKVVPLDESVISGLKVEAPESAAESREEQEELMRAIRRLPDDRQLLLVLKFVEAMSNSEIGQIMGRSEGAVKSLYHRTLLALRDDLNSRVRPNGRARHR